MELNPSDRREGEVQSRTSPQFFKFCYVQAPRACGAAGEYPLDETCEVEVLIGEGDGGCKGKSAEGIGDGLEMGEYEISRGEESVARENCTGGIGSGTVG